MDINLWLAIVLIILFAVVSAGAAAYLSFKRGQQAGVASEKERQIKLQQTAEEQAARILRDAETEVKQLRLVYKEEEVQKRNELEAEQAKRRKELERIEERLQNRLDSAERRLEQIESRERKLNQRESKLDQRAAKLTTMEEERLAELQRIAQMTQDEARQTLLTTVEQSTRLEMARTIREVEAEVMEEADRRARSIITLAIERLASEHISEYTVSSVDLPSDEMKGRIIGRQGRNIRAIEQALGVDRSSTIHLKRSLSVVSTRFVGKLLG
ncbi:MAG: Rnase Y domain-containing protein [Caldilineaceae bacterium]